MKQFTLRLACLLWLATTSLLPGPGWALCIGPTGHLAVEFAGVEVTGGLTAAATARCGDACPPDECRACNDVLLTSSDQACSRRDVAVPALALAPVALVAFLEPRITDAVARGAVAPIPSSRAPHLVSVLRR